jgi:outer membrane protein
LHRVCRLLAVGLIAPNLCGAQTTGASVPKSLDGYLGAGAVMVPNYVGGADSETKLLPLAMIEYKETVYIHLNRAGVRLWTSPEKEMALGIAAEPRIGFSPPDGPRLAGMAIRHDSVEGGPALEWERDPYALSLAWFSDWSDTSGGRSWRLSAERQLVDNGRWDVSAYLDLDHADRRIVQYFFGVPPDEATPARPSYLPGATINSALGLTGAYRLNKNYALLFGGEFSRLGAAAAASPIVERRSGSIGYLGLGLVF